MQQEQQITPERNASSEAEEEEEVCSFTSSKVPEARTNACSGTNSYKLSIQSFGDGRNDGGQKLKQLPKVKAGGGV